MKYLKKYKELILEVGESNLKPYTIKDEVDIPISLTGMGKNFLFETESGLKYSINIATNLTDMYFDFKDVLDCEIIVDEPSVFYEKLISVSYFVYEDNDDIYGTFDDTIITNRGELYRIMATLVDVLEKYLDNHPNIDYIFIGGQEGDKEGSRKQRDKLYLQYFKKLKPDWKSDKIYVQLRHEYYYILKITD